MIKHRKIIISLLLAYALFIVGIFNVKADSYWGSYGVDFGGTWGSNIQNNGYYELITLNVNLPTGSSVGSYAINHGDWLSNKIVTFVFYSSDVNVTNIHLVNNSGNSYACEIYGDSYMNNGIHTYNVICPYVGSLTWNGTSIKFATTYNSLNGSILFGISQINYFDSQAVASNQTAQNTNDINNSINDSSIDTDNTDSSVSGFSSSTNSSMSNTPVSSMISLPITFLTGVNNALSNSCTNVNYIELFGYQLVLPCLNLSERLGSVWTIIDTIFSCMLIFSIGKSLVSTFARLSDMDTNIMYECYANGTKHRGESFDD